jgi:hypothetical protein
MSMVSATSVTLAILQSICAAVLTISYVRVAIGMTALAASTIYVPVRWFHQDAIRIPMLIVATLGAVVNLAVLAWIWRLRSQSSAQWRRRVISPKEIRSERLQVAMALVTLALVGAELWTHAVVTHRGHARTATQTSLCQRAAAKERC